MLLGGGHGEFGLALDHGGHDLDMPAFARTGCSRQSPGLRSHHPRLGSLHVELVHPGTPDMRQRKAFIFADRPIEGVVGAEPGRQHAIHAFAVMRGGAIGSGRQRQIKSVPVHLLFP
jgi:hypothetical protein